ncbi:hypothetical protein V5P93_002820 [Actinokineospora auranticolor]|uniref:DUF4383 domain-containing protein n=1 Tax=Actinokineospora auranticolor TaxID=155976 RepID=A0A2S6H0K3_9PSEU|nr:hypothetical protein [Actinokineospora auranticolor]PPK70961.1 hypothetical protein CLV40_101147 [Actinokineospora auranticolor]
MSTHAHHFRLVPTQRHHQAHPVAGAAECLFLAAGLITIAIITYATGATIMPGASDDGTVGAFGNPLAAVLHLAFGAFALVAALHPPLRRIFAEILGLAFFGFTVYDLVALIFPAAEEEPLGVSWPLLVAHVTALALCVVITFSTESPEAKPA